MTIFKKNIYLLSLFLYLSIASVAQSQNVSVVAKLDTTAMLIGDQVRLDLQLSFPDKTLIRWPVIGDTIISGIQTTDRSRIDTTYSKDKKTVTVHQALRLTSFDSGFYLIPPIRFYYRQPPDTTIKMAQTETLLLKVHSMVVDTTKAIKPIKGPLKVPLTFREILPYLLGGIIILLIILAIIYYLRKRKKSEPVFQIRPKIEIPPHEIALTAIEKLKGKKLWQQGKIKEYHSELTDIIRNYIELRFGIMALEMTSMEILGSLKSRDHVRAETMEKLNFLLTLADLVKFAKMQPLPAENEISIDNAVYFVHETTIKKDQSNADDGRN
jgi:hypothetical protein